MIEQQSVALNGTTVTSACDAVQRGSLQSAAVNGNPAAGQLDRGQAAVEFAFILPLFVVIVFVTLAFARVIAAQFDVNAAAREAARAGAEIGTQNAPFAVAAGVAEARARQVIADRGLDPGTLQFQVIAGGGYDRGGTFGVQLNYSYELPYDVSGLLGLFGGSKFPGGVANLESQAFYRIQQYKSRWK